MEVHNHKIRSIASKIACKCRIFNIFLFLISPKICLGEIFRKFTKIPCELLEFSLSTRILFFLGFLVYFSFSRISSALIPLASNFFSTASASVFLASSAALASAFAFFASKDATSFSASSEQPSSLSICSSALQSLSGWMRSQYSET